MADPESRLAPGRYAQTDMLEKCVGRRAPWVAGR